MTEFVLHDNSEFENQIDLWINADQFIGQTNHSIWTYDNDDKYVMSVYPEKDFGYIIHLDFSPYRPLTNGKNLITGTKWELIKILYAVVEDYSKIFSPHKKHYTFKYVQNIWNEEQSLQMKNLITYI